MKPQDKAIAIARIADESKALDIRILNVVGICNFTDIFVIATCGSSLQLRSLGHKIQRDMRALGERAMSIVGTDTSSWVVGDFGDVVVHLFSSEARDYYRLDRLWADARTVEWAAAS